MTIRTITTKRSIWKFDLDAMIYVRFPRGEAPPPVDTQILYTCVWEPFVAIQPEGDRVLVMRPVPWGTGAVRQTGCIESDTHPGPWPELPAHTPESQNERSTGAYNSLERRWDVI
jgi:hypothetical protein